MFACLLAVALLLLPGCQQLGDIVSNVAVTGEFPVEVNGVTIGAAPQKAVVLSPSLADVILALGCETQLAAASQDCTQESLSSLQKLGAVSIGDISALGADLVLSDRLDDAFSAALQEAGITALAVSPAVNREDFERLYAQVSSAFNGGGAGYDKGVRVAQDIFTTLDDINRVVPKETVTTACYLYDLESRAVTGDQLGSTVMSYAGATNVFQSLSGGVYDFESLRISNPTVIFCVPGLREEILTDDRFGDFQAVMHDKIFEMQPSAMTWQGRTVVTTAITISGSCFPELLEESSMTVTDPIDEINSEVSSAMEAVTHSYSPLQEGDRSEAVLDLQDRLHELGYLTVEYDGMYGSITAGCVEEFQQANGLPVTGQADEATLRRLFSEDAKPAA